ncbi:MAG: YheC/YheD family protein [Brevibacillus sp.]|nr:YheC/YheD family protein [Brevibacillus sp.]
MPHIRTIVTTKQVNEAEADLTLPRTLIRSLNIPAAPLVAQFGSRVGHAVVKSGRAQVQTAIGPSLARTLLLPLGIPIRLRYVAQENRLVFGPFFGVLLSKFKSGGESPTFGVYTSFLSELVSLCQVRGGIVCVFTPDDVHWDSQTIEGMICKDGTWLRRTLPLPQCIYNRLSSREAEQSNQVAALIQRCQELGIPFFNERFLNKWHVHQVLATQSEAAAYLPHTIRYESLQELRQMLQEHRVIYAKPSNGSMGNGIVRVGRLTGGYQLQHANGRIRRYKKLSALHHAMQKLKGEKTYLLQQSLQLIGVGERPVDFRALVQKNRRGQWEVTSLVARLGQNRVVSNVARGGSMMSAVRALLVCGPWKEGTRPSAQMVKLAALKLASILDEVLPGHYAEFGIDLGVDTKGRIWLLEVNSKPSKAENTLQLPEGVIVPPRRRPRPSVRKLMEYTAYLSGFPYTSKPKRILRKLKTKKLGSR